MGCSSSKTNQMPSYNPGLASSFYWACRNGDMATMQMMLPNLTYEQINQIKPNGSTPLHAACFCNHSHIVRLLFKNGCSPTILNHYGATAYQEAASDEIRVLFHCPSSNRFVDENVSESFKLLTQNDNDISVKWINRHRSADVAHEAQFMYAMVGLSNPFNQVVKSQAEVDSIKSITNLLSKSVPTKHKHYKTMNKLFKNFLGKMDVDHLLTMHTLETPFYKNLQNDADPFTVLLYFHLHELQDRAFQGRTYRGAIMTQNDMNPYQWAFEREHHVLETRVLQSTSLNKSIAQNFSVLKSSSSIVRYSVLLIFDFPQKCQTAINLTKISETLPALSAYEYEEEVLILPYTLFLVTDIKFDSQHDQYHIILTNIATPKKTTVETIKRVK